MIKQINNFLEQYIPYDIARGITPFVLLIVAIVIAFFVLKVFKDKKKITQTTFNFYMFISPWIVGFLLFAVFPIGYSFFISFHEWDIVNDMEFIGFDNYIEAFSGGDKWFYQSLKVTLQYAFFSVPLQLVLGFLIALLLNEKVFGMRVFRTIYYMPTLVSGVALSALWMQIFNYNFGLLNSVLGMFGIPAQKWLLDENLVIPSLVFMSLWGIGGNMVIYLAGLQDVPRDLYEAAQIDGAGAFKRITRITIPLMTPVIFFNLLMGIIGSFQTFTQSFVMTQGGPNGASMFYVLNLYSHAFEKFNMGYASALAWILFIIILMFTALIFRSSDMWVYYESEVKGKKVKKRKGVM